MREAFELFHLGNNKHLTRRNTTDDSYVLPSINDAWIGFQAGAAYGSNQELTDILKLLDAAPSLPLDSCTPEELQAWTTAIKSVLVHIGAALK